MQTVLYSLPNSYNEHESPVFQLKKKAIEWFLIMKSLVETIQWGLYNCGFALFAVCNV